MDLSIMKLLEEGEDESMHSGADVEALQAALNRDIGGDASTSHNFDSDKALPVMVETVSNKIMEHITEQCLICCDVGVPCGARQACNDPSALIFPFQEAEVERCTSCKSLFHKPCFEKLTYCSCGVQIRVEEGVSYRPGGEGSRALGLLGRRSNSGLSAGLFSGLFAKAKPEKMEHKDGDNVILMGSLPSTSL